MIKHNLKVLNNTKRKKNPHTHTQTQQCFQKKNIFIPKYIIQI
jgi:hypothetical protein